MQQRVDHADDELGRLRRMPAKVQDVGTDRLDVCAALVTLELGEQLAVEIDRRDREPEPRERNRLKAATCPEVDRAFAAVRRNAARSEEVRVTRERRVPPAIHPRIDV